MWNDFSVLNKTWEQIQVTSVPAVDLKAWNSRFSLLFDYNFFFLCVWLFKKCFSEMYYFVHLCFKMFLFTQAIRPYRTRYHQWKAVIFLPSTILLFTLCSTLPLGLNQLKWSRCHMASKQACAGLIMLCPPSAHTLHHAKPTERGGRASKPPPMLQISLLPTQTYNIMSSPHMITAWA